MRHREFIAAVIGCAAMSSALEPPAAHAQQVENIPHVGFIGNSIAALDANLIKAFRDGFRERGYEEGRNIEIVSRWAEGDYVRFPALIAKLLVAKMEVLVTAGTPATLAVTGATSTVPLVMVAMGDPVGTEMVPNSVRSGSNITSLSSLTSDSSTHNWINLG